MSDAAVATASSMAAAENLPGPSGSRASDFMGVEPRRKPSSSTPLPDGRLSRIETVHRTLHALCHEWEQRKK
ncbi:unnamed protein product [Heligmosomoides polygyrus]|uniref:Type III effector n=1 Tax=Heligmosomoides polygyrus TaxID=6339 RepID=A0A183FK05_HELPZ|nr:unnamed protein product [Heligmosomoides polygyrus]